MDPGKMDASIFHNGPSEQWALKKHTSLTYWLVCNKRSGGWRGGAENRIPSVILYYKCTLTFSCLLLWSRSIWLRFRCRPAVSLCRSPLDCAHRRKCWDCQCPPSEDTETLGGRACGGKTQNNNRWECFFGGKYLEVLPTDMRCFHNPYISQSSLMI